MKEDDETEGKRGIGKEINPRAPKEENNQANPPHKIKWDLVDQLIKGSIDLETFKIAIKAFNDQAMKKDDTMGPEEGV